MVKRWDNGKEVDTTDNGRQLPPTMDDKHQLQHAKRWSNGEEEEQR